MGSGFSWWTAGGGALLNSRGRNSRLTMSGGSLPNSFSASRAVSFPASTSSRVQPVGS